MNKPYKRKAKATWKAFLDICGEQYEYGSKKWYEDQIRIGSRIEDHECEDPWCIHTVFTIERLKWESETAEYRLNQ